MDRAELRKLIREEIKSTILKEDEGKRSKQELIDRLLDQFKEDMEFGDVTVLEELLNFVPFENLLHALPEDEWDQYTDM